jgi:hypothetical protein
MDFLSLIFILFLSLFTFISADPLGQVCDHNTNINAKLSSNINSLLANLVTKTTQKGYSLDSYGKKTNKVYGLAQCRADASSQDCSSCIQDAARQIRPLCPNDAGATIWYDFCFLRYDTNNFIGRLDTSYGILYRNYENVTDTKHFNKMLGELVGEIRGQAIVKANKGFGKGQRTLTNLVTLYAFVQCARDISTLNCAQCLAVAVENVFPGFCANRKGCRVLYGSCFVRYELYPIYFPLAKNNNKIGMQSNRQSETVKRYP